MKRSSLLKLKRLQINQSYLPYFVYFSLSLAILLPLLKPGYILLLDMVFGPNYRMSSSYGQFPVAIAFPREVVIWLATKVIPSWVVQRILLFLALFLSGLSMHLLVPTNREGPRYFGGFLYMVNPFVYVRLLAGHWFLVLAYAITPFVVKSIFNFFDRPSLKGSAKIGLWMTLLALVNVHNLFVWFLFGFGVFFYLVYSWAGGGYRSRLVKFSALAVILFLLLNVYWIVSFAGSHSPVANFGRYLNAFGTERGAYTGSVLNTAAMYGFWQKQVYLDPRNFLSGWYVFLGFILFFSILGLILGSSDKEKWIKVKIVGVTGFLALILAVGNAHPFTEKIFMFFYSYFPFFKGYREPQKFVALVVLTYAYLGGVGLDRALEKLSKLKEITQKKQLSRVLPAAILVLAIASPLVYTYPVFWGFLGQMKPVDYPYSWYKVDKLTSHEQGNFKVLFLPWHMYLAFGFNDSQKTIAVPAIYFFEKPVVQSNNWRIYDIYTFSPDAQSRFIEEMVENRGEVDGLGRRLASFNIRYVILSKVGDYRNYYWLNFKKDLKFIYESDDIMLYQNRKHKIAKKI